MTPRLLACVFPAVFAMYIPMCGPGIKLTAPPSGVTIDALWQDPTDIQARDAFLGPWGAANAPDADALYHFVGTKKSGTSPGLTVSDAKGREWHVKQAPPTSEGAEGPIEVVLSRVLSTVGYHQPPVYFVPSFKVADTKGGRIESGGRFRLHDAAMKEGGLWEWEQNPFVDSKPYQGLLVILLMFNSSDLKNINNSVYDVAHTGADSARWYVVRDLGTALGETGKLAPRRGDPDLFDREPFITNVGEDGFVRFAYSGWHQNIIQGRIRIDDVRWASDLLSRLSNGQWHDAFRAGGFETTLADRFIVRLHEKISQGQRLKGRPEPAVLIQPSVRQR